MFTQITHNGHDYYIDSNKISYIEVYFFNAPKILVMYEKGTSITLEFKTEQERQVVLDKILGKAEPSII